MSIKTASVTSIMNLGSEKGSDLTYRDLKIACIIRGMPPEEVLKADFFKLSNFAQTNVLVKENHDLLEKFDDYVEAILRERGQTDLIHNSLRLSYVRKDNDDEYTPSNARTRLIKEKPEKKAPREKDSNGLFKGTMKSYTFELQKKGKTLDQVMIKVRRKFPESKEKSIKIWYNKSKKG